MDNSSQKHNRPGTDLTPQILMPGLRKRLEASSGGDLHHVIIEVNALAATTLPETRRRVRKLVEDVIGNRARNALRRDDLDSLHPYVFAELSRDEIMYLVQHDGAAAKAADTRAMMQNSDEAPRGRDARVGPPTPHRSLRAIYKIWESTPMSPLANVSIRTVKADAAHTAFSASGRGVVWAILDSGIDRNHTHFDQFANLLLDEPLLHKDFTPSSDIGADTSELALSDPYGHGTHVAGIIAGIAKTSPTPIAATQSVDEDGRGSDYHLHAVDGICGMAPECKLLSLRILDETGAGDVTAAINALDYVMRLNAYGAHYAVHGINISAGYLPEVRWYGTGQTPLCLMVDRVVASGVSVVVAAGNTGYVITQSVQDDATATFEAAQLASINDPGNANLAITVGSTHRQKPHVFGISYFSSKGPTADGRRKPDVVAPGEKIISCAAGSSKATVAALVSASVQTVPIPTSAQLTGAMPITPPAPVFNYIEDSGTSMAAPHVSGVLAAFLSVRPEFIGKAQDLRDLVIASAIDLKRDSRMQGAGLIDLMRMLQSV